MPRKSYKSLYVSTTARLTAVLEENARLSCELERLRGVLADHAKEETIPSINDFLKVYPLADAIPLYPLSYEALRAHLMKANIQRVYPDGVVVDLAGRENLLWRGKPLVCKP